MLVPAKPYQVELRDTWLIASFPEPWAVVSWAIANGGWQRAQRVAWLFLQRNEIAGVDDVPAWMRARMHRQHLAGAVGFMTSRRPLAFVESAATESDSHAWVIGTVGLSNRLRAGDPCSASHTGTINLLACTSQALTVEAALEAICLVTEAKTLAMLESGEDSVCSGMPATGTGTDCVALAWPVAAEQICYAGKHTALGSALGRAAYLAVSEGIREWKAEQV